MWFPTLTLLAILSALLALSASTPLDHPSNGRSSGQFHARQDGTFHITGPAGGVHPRLEIREMENNGPLWNLFLAALEQWMAVDQNDKLSFFQIAAIHGQPLQPWDGVEATGNNQVGFCPHDSNVFGTWHRPYLAVFEQLLQAQAIAIADALPEGDTKSQYQGLAQQLRWPFWDWAMNPPNGGPIIPQSVTSETVEIAYPNGTRSNRPNPLYQYNFHPLQQGWFGGVYANWDRTVRNPANVNNFNSPSNNAEAEQNLQGGQASRRQSLYNILTQHQTFNQFSNHGSGDSPIGSLESIHDGVHGAFGQGHMQYLTVSAFDPIFWLHHANIDRLIVLFQYIYPDTWIEPWQQRGDTWVYRAGTTLDKFSPLQPFHDSTSGSVWNSAIGAGWTVYGYTYPEIANNESNDTVRATINSLYGSSSVAVTGLSKRIESTGPVGKTYLAAIEAPLQALDGPYSVQVYLGDPGSDLFNIASSPSYVGAMSILAQPGMHNDDVVRGSVPLTERLNQNTLSGLLSDLGLDAMLANLKTELHYRVIQNGQEVPKANIPGLKVAVFTADVTPAASESDFPLWGPLTKHVDANDGWPAWDDDAY